MKYRFLLIGLFVSCLSWAAPAQRGSFTLSQPDGSCFSALLRGDEYCKIFTTESGEAITRDADGWYCYAYYLWNGHKYSSGIPVCETADPAVRSRSRQIPYPALSGLARSKRSQHPWGGLKKNPLPRAQAGQSKHGLIILAQFADLKFKYNRSQFEQLINADNGSSVSAYYADQFGGTVHFSFVLSDIVTLANGYAYYGKNDSTGEDLNAHAMIAEACRLADAQIDFSQFDDDGDGYVDNVFVYFAGGDEAGGAGEDHIWSHQHYLSTDGQQIVLDGVTIDNYACTSELVRGNRGDIMATIGTFCHEYLHTFGLPDYYDTDYGESGGTAEALWQSTALLDSGNWNNLGKTPPNFNAMDRYLLGLGTAEELQEGEYTLTADGSYSILRGPTAGEFYLFECRKASGWDAYIGGSGLLIYHVDMSEQTVLGTSALRRWQLNSLNCVPSHQCLDLVEAAPAAVSVEEVFFPRSDSKRFTPSSHPAFVFWNGDPAPLALTAISRKGDDILLQIGHSQEEAAPEVEDIGKAVFQDAAILLWRSGDPAYGGPSYISWGETGKESEEILVNAFELGHYAYILEGLKPDKSYTVSLYFKSGSVRGKERSASLITQSYAENSLPYIYLKDIPKASDGAFPSGSQIPLRVYNAPYQQGVNWFLDDAPIQVESDGYYRLRQSGILRAVVQCADGSQEIIQRKITVR